MFTPRPMTNLLSPKIVQGIDFVLWNRNENKSEFVLPLQEWDALPEVVIMVVSCSVHCDLQA